MGNVLPGLDDFYRVYMSPPEWKTFIVFQWLNIALFGALVILVSVNIWQIIIRQRKWGNLPLLFFYIFATLGILLRETLLIFAYASWMNNKVNILQFEEPMTKLGAGVVQSWIIFEIAL